MAFHVSFLSLDCSQIDSNLTVVLTEGKRVFYLSVLSLVSSGNGFASGRVSYGQTSTYLPCHTYYVIALSFVCPYVCTKLAHLCITVHFPLIATVWIGVTATVWIGVSTALARLCTIWWWILSKEFSIYTHVAQIYLWWCCGWYFVKESPMFWIPSFQ